MSTLTKFDLVLAVAFFCLVLAALLIVADGRYALDPDGVRELHAAQNLVDGEGLVDKVIRETSGAPVHSPCSPNHLCIT